MEGDCVAGENRAASPQDSDAEQGRFAALVEAMREQWNGIDADGRAFLVYCLQRLRAQARPGRYGRGVRGRRNDTEIGTEN